MVRPLKCIDRSIDERNRVRSSEETSSEKKIFIDPCETTGGRLPFERRLCRRNTSDSSGRTSSIHDRLDRK